MDVIIYRKTGGGVAVGRVYSAAGQLLCDPEVEGARIVAATDEFESFRVGKVQDLPGGTGGGRYDRYFFDAFTDDNDGPTVDIDMPRAREVQMGLIRAARDLRLAELDIEQLKGIDVAAEKQVLRDLPEKFSLDSKTPEALRKRWPVEL